MIAPFSGWDEEDGQQFLHAFKGELAAFGTMAPEARVEYFPLCLESGSWVEDWYQRLPVAIQASWNLLEATFRQRWT
jgi:hypothetical protein